MINEIVVILTIVEGVQSQAVEERAFVLGLSHNKRNFGELALHQKVLWGVRKYVSVNIGSEPSGE